MEVTVLFFGSLSEIAGTSVVLKDIHDLTGLLNQLKNIYPALSSSKYIVAVDKEIISENRLLKDGSVVALMPPFSGG